MHAPQQSANGTFLNGERLPSHSWHPLALGQQVGFGGPAADEPQLFVFLVTDSDPNDLVSEAAAGTLGGRRSAVAAAAGHGETPARSHSPPPASDKCADRNIG